MYRFSEHDNGIVSLAFSDDEVRIAVGSLNVPNPFLTLASFPPSPRPRTLQRLMASVGRDGKLIIWDVLTGMIVTSVYAKPVQCDIVRWAGMVKGAGTSNAVLPGFTPLNHQT